MAEDDRPPPVDTPERRAQLAARRGHPTGPHIRDRPHPDEVNHPVAPPPADAGTLALQVEALTDMMQNVMGRLEMGRNVPQQPVPPKAEVWTPGVIVAIIGLAVTVGGSAIAVVQSTTRLADKVETMDVRLTTVEGRQVANLPKLEAQITENKMQNDRINAVVESLADVRRAGQANEVENRHAQAEIMALIAKQNDKLADVLRDVAVIQATGRRNDRSELAPPVRDAQVMRGQ